MTPQEQPDSQAIRCVICNVYCDESGLCDKHKYDEQIKPDSQAGDELEEFLDMLLPLVDTGYFVNGIDIGREGAKEVLRGYAERLATKRAIEARIDELHRFSESFLTGRGLMWVIARNQELKELSATLTKEEQ